ncbi:Non-specific lipid-transfer protein 3 [Linum grandiflorum]
MSRYLAAVFLAIIILVANNGGGVAAQAPKRAAPPCSSVYAALQPCISYLTGSGEITEGEQPSEECCSGVKALQPFSVSKPDRVSMCECFKSLVGSVPQVDLALASKLPGNCKVNVQLPKLSMDFDCSKA